MKNEINNDIIISVIAGSLLLFLLCVFIVAFTLLYFKKKREHKFEKERLASEFAKTLLKSQLEIKEQTLQDISHELHDNLGLNASLTKIYLNTIDFNDKSDIQKKISDSKELIKQLIKDIKLLSLDLNSDRAIQLGLSRVLVLEIDKLNKTKGVNAIMFISGEEFILPSATTTILYRMSQEVINNIIKHSYATEISIQLNFLQNFFILEVKDNGVGFDITKKLNGSGNGLINLKNRAKVINAKFNIKSSPNQGTTITIEIPK